MRIVVDDAQNILIPKSNTAGSPTRHWDIVDAAGKLRSTVTVPDNRVIMAVTRTHVYTKYQDSDGLQWIERYRR